MPKWLNPVLHATQSLAIVGLVTWAAATGRVSWAWAGAVIGSFGGVWTWVGGALVTSAKSAAATTPTAGDGAPVATPTPVPTPSGYPVGRAPSDAAPAG